MSAPSSSPDPASVPRSAELIGRTLGRYRVEAPLGQGGLATVWKARDTLLGRTVALKILDDALAGQPHARRRFLHEAQAAALLDHPGIVAVFDAGEAEGRTYIALSLIDGETVHAIATRRLMPVPEAVRIVAAAAEALGHAHTRGVIHRDVTARNIMVARDGRVYVLDFGLALALGSSRLTTSGSTMGTVAYMSPEVARGEEADARSDLYGLGIVLYEALTGGYPFPGERPEAMLYAALNEPPRPPRERRPEIPPALECVVLRAIARDPGARYPSAAEMIAALRASALETPHIEPAAVTRAAEPDPAPAGSVSPPRVPAARPDPLFLAVLPFERAGSAADADGAIESLASRLSGTLCAALAGGRVHVIPSSAPVSASQADVRSLARALGANALLRGTVARSGSQLRVTWSVLDPEGGAQLAGGVADGSAFSPFDLEDRVVSGVTRALDLPAAKAAATPASRPRDPAAGERLAQALGYLRRYDNEASVDGAIRLLEQLMASEGDSAALHAALARAYIGKYQLTRERIWEARAASECERARLLDADAAEVLLAFGDLHLATGLHAEAEAEYARALEQRRPLGRHGGGLVDRVHLDDDHPAQELLGLDERPVGGDRLAGSATDGANHFRPGQVGAGSNSIAVLGEPGDVVRDRGGALLLREGEPARGVVGIRIGEEHEAHRLVLAGQWRAGGRRPNRTTNEPRRESTKRRAGRAALRAGTRTAAWRCTRWRDRAGRGCPRWCAARRSACAAWTR